MCFLLACFPLLSQGFCDKRTSCTSNLGSFFHCACILYRDMKHLESSVNTQKGSQNDHPSLKIPHEIRANSWVPARVCDVEGDAVCSKNSTFGYFDGAPHLLFFIMTPRLWLLTITKCNLHFNYGTWPSSKIFISIFLWILFLNRNDNISRIILKEKKWSLTLENNTYRHFHAVIDKIGSI